MISIIKREWMRLSKQPKVIITTFLLPCALISLVMGIFFSGVLEKKPQKIAVVSDSPEVKAFITDSKLYKEVLILEKKIKNWKPCIIKEK